MWSSSSRSRGDLQSDSWKVIASNEMSEEGAHLLQKKSNISWQSSYKLLHHGVPSICSKCRGFDSAEVTILSSVMKIRLAAYLNCA